MGTDKRDRQKAARQQRLLEEAEALRAQQQRGRSTRLLGLAIVAALVVGGVVWLLSRGGDDSESVDTAAQDLATTPVDADAPTTLPPTASGPDVTPLVPLLAAGADLPAECPDGSEQRIDFEGPPPMCLYEDTTYTAVFDTTLGEVRVELDTENTPVTANNFATLARWGYYDNTLVHRTAPSIDIIQGGSPHTNTAADPGPGYRLADEGAFRPDGGGVVADYTYVPGDLAMARTAQPNGAGAQWFFVTGPNGALLDGGPAATGGQGSYVVFGATDADGIAVTQQILDLHDPATNSPSEDVVVNSVTIEES